MRKIITTFGLLLLSAVGLWAQTEIDGLLYKLNYADKTAEVSGCSASEVVIPASVRCFNVDYAVTSIGYNAFFNCTNLTNISIPSSVKSIGDYAFEDCTGLTGISIPSSVESIGESAFQGCTNLTGISIPSSVESIGNWAFVGCTGLTNISFSSPSSVTSIGAYAFRGCSSLTGISIPSSVTSLGEGAFYGCISLKSITVDKDNSYYSSDSQGILYNKEITTIVCCPEGKTGSVDIPSSVTSLGEGAFEGCSSLTSISIPSSVESIGDWAFDGCTSLKSITVDKDNSYYSSDSQGILYNKEMTTIVCCPEGKTGSVIIPTSVTSLGEVAFDGCTNLTGITIPSSVTSLGEGAFDGCTSLKSITVDKDNSYYSSDSQGILYNKEMTTIVCCPEGKTGNVIIPTSVTSIGNYAFEGCSSLTGITIPTSVTSIGNYAFEGCSSLTGITIPSSVTSIGESVFVGCLNLTSITCEATTPPSVVTGFLDAFFGVSKDIRVIVPHGTIEAYKKADGWSSFTNFVEAEARAVGAVQADKGLSVSGRVVSNPEGAVVRVFTLGGAQVLCSSETVIDLGGLPTGVYVVRANGMGQKVVVR